MGKSNVDDLYVMDKTANAVCPERIHEIIVNGKVVSYTFKALERTKMPFAHAMKYLKHDFMEVTDEGGRPYKAAPGVAVDAAGMATTMLPPDQVIANLDELTVGALTIRVNAEPGGEKFNKRSGRDKLIAFLVEARGPGSDAESEPDETATADASDAVDMGPGEEEKFFGGEGDSDAESEEG